MRAFGKRGGSNNQNDEGLEDENLPPEDYYQEEFSASTLDSEQGDDDWDSLSSDEDSVIAQAEEMKQRSSPIARMIPWFALGVIVAGGIVYYLTAHMGAGVIQQGNVITAAPVAPSTNTTGEQFGKPLAPRGEPSGTRSNAGSTSSGSPETSSPSSVPALPSDAASATAQSARSGSFIPSEDGTIKWVEPIQSPDQTANKGNVTETGTAATSTATTTTNAASTSRSATEQTATSQPQTTPVAGSEETVKTPVVSPPDFSQQMASMNSSPVTDKPASTDSRSASAAQATSPLKEQTAPIAQATSKNIQTTNDQQVSESIAGTTSTPSSDVVTNERSPQSLLMSAVQSTADQAKIPPVETPAPTTTAPTAVAQTTAEIKPTGTSSTAQVDQVTKPASPATPTTSAVNSSEGASSPTSTSSLSGLTSTLVPTLTPTTSPDSSPGLGVNSSLPPPVDATKTPSASTEDVDDLNSRMAVLEQRLGDLTQALDKVAVQSTSKSSAASERNAQTTAQANALNTQLSAQIKSLQSEMQSLKSQVKDQSQVAPSPVSTSSPVATSVEKEQPVKTIPLLPSSSKAESHKTATAGVSPSAQSASVKAWELRAAQAGEAWVARKGSNNLQHITVGQSVPGLGRVTSIREKNGAWVVVTTGGTLRQ